MSLLNLKNKLTVFAVAGFLLIASGTPYAKADEQQKGDDFVVLVNGSGVSQKGYDRALIVAKKQFDRLALEKGDDWKKQHGDYNEKVLQQLIDLEILYQDAVARGIRVEDSVIETDLENMRGKFKDKEGFTEFLQQNDLSEEELRMGVRKKRTAELLQFVLQDEMTAKVHVDDEKVKEYYEKNIDLFKRPERVKVNQILVAYDKKGGEEVEKEAREKIKKIQEQIKDGKDFLELARTVSDAPTRDKAGELGYFSRGMLVKPFEDAAFSLKPGEVSDVVESLDGFHLIRLQDHKPADTAEFSEVKDKIHEELFQAQMNVLYNEYIEDLRSKAKITRQVKSEKK